MSEKADTAKIANGINSRLAEGGFVNVNAKTVVNVDDLFEVYPELAPARSEFTFMFSPNFGEKKFAEALAIAAKQSRDAKIVARLNKIDKKED